VLASTLSSTPRKIGIDFLISCNVQGRPRSTQPSGRNKPSVFNYLWSLLHGCCMDSLPINSQTTLPSGLKTCPLTPFGVL
jgi:hypothetical protein